MTEVSACFRQIDTDIDANEEDIRNAAYWLDKLKKGFIEAEKDMNVSRRSRMRVSGKFGDTIRSIGDDLGSACDSAEDDLDDVIDIIRSWADQVKWRKDDMADCRDEATDGGLVVNDMIIEYPVEVQPAGDLPRGATRDQKKEWQKRKDAYQDYLDKVELFNDLETEVKDIRQKLTDWVAKHMVIDEANEGSWVMVLAKNYKNDAFCTALGLFSSRVYEWHLRALAADATTKKMIERVRAKSPSPKVRSGEWAPNEKSIEKRTAVSLKAQAGKIKEVAGRIANPVGVVTSLVFAGYSISQGSSPSRVTVETGVAIATTIGVGSVLVTGWLPALVATGVGTVAAMATGWVYEEVVPLEVREWIDEGMEDVWDCISDGAESVWDAIFE